MISNISHIISIPLYQSLVSTSSSMPQVAKPIVANLTVHDPMNNKDLQGVEAENALTEAVDHLNTNIQKVNRNLVFSLDKDSGEVVVKVVDSQTHEIIRQIPNEVALALARHIKQYELDHHVGLMQDKA